MTRLYANNAASTLSAGISASDTSLTVANGALFPSPIAPDFFTVTLTQSGSESSWEEVKVTSRSGNVLNIARAQEGTTAAIWAGGSKVEIRFTSLAAADAANTGVAGDAVLDFGSGANFTSVVIVGQTDIKSNSMIQAWLMAVDSADHTPMEHAIVPMRVSCGNIVAESSFEIFGYSDITLTGSWAVQWVRTR